MARGSSIDARQMTSTFHVRDLDRARAQYESLGFTACPRTAGGCGCILERGNLVLHLIEERDRGSDDEAAVAYLEVEDAVVIALEWSRLSADGMTTFPTRTAQGFREGLYRDPDNNVIRFRSS